MGPACSWIRLTLFNEFLFVRNLINGVFWIFWSKKGIGDKPIMIWEKKLTLQFWIKLTTTGWSVVENEFHGWERIPGCIQHDTSWVWFLALINRTIVVRKGLKCLCESFGFRNGRLLRRYHQLIPLKKIKNKNYELDWRGIWPSFNWYQCQ